MQNSTDMNQIGYFEIEVDNPERAINFYATVFGWRFEKRKSNSMDYWGIQCTPVDAEGQSQEGLVSFGGMLRRSTVRPAEGSGANAYVTTILVEDQHTIAQKIVAAGGHEVMAKFPVVGRGWQGYYRDTEGNLLGIFQIDQSAQ